MDATAGLRVERSDEDRTTAALYRAHVPAAVRLASPLTGDAATAQDVATTPCSSRPPGSAFSTIPTGTPDPGWTNGVDPVTGDR